VRAAEDEEGGGAVELDESVSLPWLEDEVWQSVPGQQNELQSKEELERTDEDRTGSSLIEDDETLAELDTAS